MNALANEAQQHELEYNRQLQQMQSKLDDLRNERSAGDSRIEALKAELAAATQRADAAEAKRREADEQLETIKKKTASFQSTQRENQKLSLIHISVLPSCGPVALRPPARALSRWNTARPRWWTASAAARPPA